MAIVREASTTQFQLFLLSQHKRIWHGAVLLSTMLSYLNMIKILQ